MNRQTAIDRLQAREAELRGLGVVGLSLFGSTARGELRPDSDVDVALTLDLARTLDLFRYAVLGGRLEAILGTRVDAMCELVAKPFLRRCID